VEPRFGEALLNGFVQDEITLAPRLRATLGGKVEHTNVAGWNFQPTARLWWSPDGETALWGAVSRAVRTPSRTDTSVRFHAGADATAGPLPMLFGYLGNPDADNETLTAYEAGLRSMLWDRVVLDVGGFFNRYGQLLATEPLAPRLEIDPFGPHILLANTVRNTLDADTVGAEAVATVTLAPTWHLTGTVEVFRLSASRSANPQESAAIVDGATPRFQWSLRTSYSKVGFDFDGSLMHAAALPSPFVPAYTRLDARVGRRLGSGLEVALTGQNLQPGAHVESADTTLLAAINPAPRTISLRAIWHVGGR
jgi:iron complex outermembrane receptor protein